MANVGRRKEEFKFRAELQESINAYLLVIHNFHYLPIKARSWIRKVGRIISKYSTFTTTPSNFMSIQTTYSDDLTFGIS